MKLRYTNPYIHIFYWVFVVFILTLIFGHSWGSKKDALYFIIMLLPIVMGTSYFFNYFLVPAYLLKKKYFNFVLYLFYTLVLSLYLEMIVLTFSYVYLAQFNLGKMGLYASDIIVLAVVLYLLVFFGSFILMIQQILKSQKEITALREEKSKMETGYIEFVSNRKTHRIPFDKIKYIESLADYIKVHYSDHQQLQSKEKISSLEKRLPGIFLRIHRSFIINTEKLSHYKYDEVDIEGILLTIGRSYRTDVMRKLKSIKRN